ncbi:4-hydroxy-tetrahydrodipicolinate reductase [Puniceicoccales bacterium CK1056]|uniref:4-hydroxy-tetrahydrodipicolinate reductase n=1 Tax=Oceanipulchritudo coccoides TaxID=2706888 RepID=A0A6B2M044_9BACT|nr:4-hydroxy-tetrahydrodipicolinate reductase [Oceanipulchritudo coccoides]NDV61679.1 4-hydroxy-tetrahydrodipicolinate reductase [Oceanipulchritudo coccoides]
MSTPLTVLICGYKGRMGQTLLSIAESENARVGAQRDAGDALGEGIDNCQVAIDFSFHSATAELAGICATQDIPLVIGTTGHTDEEREQILEATKSIPVVWAGNYSVGVNLLFHLTELSARVLGDRYQPEIMEVHHKHKKDAPSGTALNLAEAIEATPDFSSAIRCSGRDGETGARPDGEIGLHALRGGEVVGEHTVFLFGDHDRIELTHRASDRRIFATGAYRAAHWVASQKPGLYSMRDVLGLTQPGALKA